MDNKVLIIVVNYNREADTIACIDSLLDQNHKSFHIGLIDNNSESIENLISKFDSDFRISIIKNDVNLGFAKANNKVVTLLDPDLDKFDFIALINNDAVADPDWLNQMIQCANENNAGQIASCIINYDNRTILDNIGHQMINTGEIVPIGHREKVIEYDKPITTFGSCAAGSMYSTKMIKQVGFFDPFFDTGYEDAELGVRAVIGGYTCTYCPDAKVYHKISQSVSAIDDRDYRLRQQINIYYSYFKLMPTIVILKNLPFMFVKYSMVILVEFITFKWSYIKLHIDTVKGVYSLRDEIKAARKQFYHKQPKVPVFRILFAQKFFLFYDLKRLVNFIFRGQKSVFDKSIENQKI